jgi:hypothetical protein
MSTHPPVFPAASFVKTKLFREPIYREDGELWQTLRGERDEIRHYFRQIGQELETLLEAAPLYYAHRRLDLRRREAEALAARLAQLNGQKTELEETRRRDEVERDAKFQEIATDMERAVPEPAATVDGVRRTSQDAELSFGEPIVPWSGTRFGLLEAEVYRIAQALIEASNVDRERSNS